MTPEDRKLIDAAREHGTDLRDRADQIDAAQALLDRIGPQTTITAVLPYKEAHANVPTALQPLVTDTVRDVVQGAVRDWLAELRDRASLPAAPVAPAGPRHPASLTILSALHAIAENGDPPPTRATLFERIRNRARAKAPTEDNLHKAICLLQAEREVLVDGEYVWLRPAAPDGIEPHVADVWHAMARFAPGTLLTVGDIENAMRVMTMPPPIPGAIPRALETLMAHGLAGSHAKGVFTLTRRPT